MDEEKLKTTSVILKPKTNCFGIGKKTIALKSNFFPHAETTGSNLTRVLEFPSRHDALH